MDESGNHKQAEQRERIRWIVSILIPLLCALLSFCVIAKYTSSPTMKINAHAIQSLDDKKTTALELTAAATAASAAITLIPGDAGTPIADKLADLSSYFLIVVCAIYLEKYLVTITGLAAFKLLIPIGCILLSLCFGFKKDLGRTIAYKLVLFGLAVYLVVPVSVRVADLIDATYGASMENPLHRQSRRRMRSKARQIHRVRRAVVLILVGRVVSGRDWWTRLRIPSPEQK